MPRHSREYSTSTAAMPGPAAEPEASRSAARTEAQAGWFDTPT